jgi:hypothetical protein
MYMHLPRYLQAWAGTSHGENESIKKKGNWTTPPGYLSSFRTSAETQIQQTAIPIPLQKSIQKKKSTCHSLFFSRRLKLRHDHPSGTPRKRCSSPLRRFGRSLVLKGSSLSSAASGSRLSSGRSILNLLTLPSRFPLLALPSSKKGVKSGEGWIHLGASFRHRRRIPRLERSIFSYCCLRVAADVQSITVDGAER